ncbi:MAG TPA: PQQ-binding-like beta-propeller repeat protein, partial [Burkholderiales bacterium]|nr:PQQ-binding-like beta-propeller repeat protein [Burkholderiales bacterium]
MNTFPRIFALTVLAVGIQYGIPAANPTIAPALAADAPQSGQGWYTSQQAKEGATAYHANCAACHGDDMRGGAGPALKGSSFMAKWGDRTVHDLYAFEHSSMPLTNPGSLDKQKYVNITAYILAQNGFPSGSQPLTLNAPTMNQALKTGVHTSQSGASSNAATTAQVDSQQQPDGNSAGAQTSTATDQSSQAGQGPAAGSDSKVVLQEPSATGPSQDELNQADRDGRSWLMYNKGYMGYRFSPLDQLDTHNAAQMKAVCALQLGENGAFQPGLVEYDGVIYATTMRNTYAMDATTCTKLWSYSHTPTGPEIYTTNRGVALARGRVIRGTQDGHLFALDAKTGKLLWDKQIVDSKQGDFISAAPIVWNDMVFVGKGGADWGVHGGMMAYNITDGSLIWRFALTPEGEHTGADTWKIPESAAHGGGSTWSTYALDAETGTLFVPVGNPAPDFHGEVRPGSNLFTDSVVAIDARNGKLKWWYQLVPHDTHDWD